MKSFAADELPKILAANDGRKIETKQAWETVRRPEILRTFTEEVFGKAPSKPETMTVTRTLRRVDALDGQAILEQYSITLKAPYGEFCFPFVIFLPKKGWPCPATLLICNRDREENMDVTRARRTGFWPVESIVARGYCACAFFVGDVDMDADDDSIHGIQRVYTPQRGEHDWATLSAWAWGASRVMDALERDARIDPKRVAVVGQSRGGKTSLYCAAMDSRFAAVYSSNSGCVGTALSHFKDGETLRQINEVFPYWFCGAFKKYNDHERTLPFDQHELMACIAPRILYASASTLDDWADPDAEFLGVQMAGCAWEFYGQSGLPQDAPMKPDEPVWGGRVGFHNRTGEHDLTEIDWMHFLDFWEARG